MSRGDSRVFDDFFNYLLNMTAYTITGRHSGVPCDI